MNVFVLIQSACLNDLDSEKLRLCDLSIVCERVDDPVKALHRSIMSSDPVDMVTQERTRFTIREQGAFFIGEPKSPSR